MEDRVQESFEELKAFCESQEFKGYDPYDGLTSRFFRALPVINQNNLARLIWIQGFKRSPVNLRPLVGIDKDYNPKALGLFLSGYVLLFKMEQRNEYLDRISFFINKIQALSSAGYSGKCWGYNFDWESRAFFLPKYTPTIVVSSYVANALLDAFEIISDDRLLSAARSTCDFILKDLNRIYDENGNFIFSYSKSDKSPVFNASLLGCRLLARVSSFTGEEHLLKEAGKSVIYVCNAQRNDGSWCYGNLPFHQWVDNFHTGFNLECISDFIKYSGDQSFDNYLQKGFNYYMNTFFTPEGVAKYYNNSIYPIDIHAPAQFIITLSKLGKFQDYLPLVNKVLDYTIKHMQSPKGFFYYQINKYFTSRIPYMRWSQAWMFYALSKYLSETRDIKNVSILNNHIYQKR